MSDEEINLGAASPTVDVLVSNWLNGEDMTVDAAIPFPEADQEVVWQAVLCIMQQDLSEKEEALLAAGPVESLLSWHGAQFMDRIEAEARQSPAFAHILGGVWRRDMPDEIWQRVEAARGGNTW
jgi:hypothetical protein